MSDKNQISLHLLEIYVQNLYSCALIKGFVINPSCMHSNHSTLYVWYTYHAIWQKAVFCTDCTSRRTSPL